MVKRCQAPLMCFCQRQQVNVGDLVMAKYARPVNQAAGSQGQAVGPELVIQVGANFVQFVADRLEADRAEFAVARQIQYPNHTVFHQGAGRNFQVLLRKESQRCRVVDMRFVQQRNPDVDIEQITQVKRPLDPSDRGHAQW